MDEHLKTYPEEMKRELRAELQGVEARTAGTRRAELHGVEERTAALIAGEIGTVHTELKGMENRMQSHVNETVFNSETKLPGEFRKWARTSDGRYRQHQGTVAGLNERVMEGGGACFKA